jgi:UDP-N-acetylglucosamine--N-acetylmuramyl-(pentapeptide) pyrophosphoryl-undecaprenol N-acetylglucosamine transferase
MKLFFAGGGTLGPVTPLLAVMQEIRKKRPDAECVFVGTPSGPERLLVEGAGFRFVAFDAPKLRRYLSPRTLLLPFTLAAAVARAIGLIGRERPDVVVGAGGYVSVPIGIAARLRGARLLIHQQDVIPSLSNRLLSPLADAVTVTFERSLGDYPKRKTALIGNPVRAIFEAADRARGLQRLGLSGERPVVLALGGGTGSVFLNDLVARSAEGLNGSCDLVHLTGLEKDDAPAPRLDRPERYRRLPFAGPEIADYFAAADLVVARAGLGTLTELAALSKPVVIVPIKGTHQEANAAYVVERGAGRIFREQDADPGRFADAVRVLIRNAEDRRRLGRGLHDLFVPGARAALTEKILKLL